MALFLLCVPMLAAVDGTVTNQTTGKPQDGAVVQLFKLGQAGPEFLANTKSDAAGTFKFDRTLEPGPHLLETSYSGVNYTTVLTPGAPTTGVQVSVYDTTSKAAAVPLAQHIVFLEPNGQQAAITETFFFKNDGKLTYHDPANGTLHFFVPPAGKSTLRVMATAPGSMAVARDPDPGKTAGVYGLSFPIKPGETRIDVAYTIPLSDSGAFTSKVLYPVPTRLAVPNGVTLEGKDLKSLGQEPQTQAALYEAPGPALEVKVVGTGSLRAAADSGGGEEEENGPTMRFIEPPGFADHKFEILALAAAVLALGFVVLYRRGQRAPAGAKSRG